MPNVLPSGRVTFLFTDIQGSTQLWEEHPEGMAAALEVHDRMLEDCVKDANGVVVKTMGDGLMAAFRTEVEASEAALSAQLAMIETGWPLPSPLLVRMGVHTGEAIERNGDYFGPTLNRAARLMGVGHGGQILVSAATAAALDQSHLTDLGSHRLRDLTAPEQIYQLTDERLRDAHPPLKTVDLTPNNLPIEVTSLIGRDEEVAATAAALLNARLVTLTGFGGMGKTRLATAAAAVVVDRYPDGVWFGPLVEASNESLVATVAGILGVIEHSDADLLESLSRVIGDKRMLLVLDNCEHVIGEVRRVVDHLLRRAPNLRILTTSRETLGSAEETVLPVAPLATGSLSEPSARLFLERMQAAGAPEPDPATFDAIASICVRLDGIPLALELAAARTRSMTPADIDRRLSRIMATRSVEGATQRNATIGSTIEWSHDLLSPAEKMLYRRLAVFVGGFDLDGAEQVCALGDIDSGDIWEHLDSLVAKSMVMPANKGGPSRYRMLEPLRGDALERLRSVDEEAAMTVTHLAHFAAFGDAAVEILQTPGEAEFLDRYFADFANIRAANEHAVAKGDVDRGLRTSLPFASHASAQHRFEICDWLEATMELPGAFNHPSAVQACAFIYALRDIRGQDNQSVLWGFKALELAGDDLPPMLQVGLALYGGIDPVLLTEAIETLRVIETPDLHLEAYIRMYLAGHVRRVDRAAGVQETRTHLEWAHATGVGTIVAYCTVVLAENLTWAGVGPEAYEVACEAERVARRVGAVWYETHAQLHKARSALFGAEPEEPVDQLFAGALRTARDNGSTHQQWTILETIPHYFAAAGRLEEAAILVAGRTKSHIEWIQDGTMTQTSYLERIPDETLEQGRETAEGMTIDDLVALAFATLETIPADFRLESVDHEAR